MNEENYTRPPTKLPDQILETQEDLGQVKEPDDPETGMDDFDKMMENPFSCAICKESFASPQKLEIHVTNHRRSTPKPQGSQRAQNPQLGSSFIPQDTEEELVSNTPFLEPQDTHKLPEPQTQEATHELATGGEAEEEQNLDPELLLEDTQIIPETPDQDTTRGCDPGGDSGGDESLDPNRPNQEIRIIPETPDLDAGGEIAEQSNLNESDDTPKHDPLALPGPSTPETYREPTQATTPGSPPGRMSEEEASTGSSPGLNYNTQIWFGPDEDISETLRDEIAISAEEGWCTENLENEVKLAQEPENHPNPQEDQNIDTPITEVKPNGKEPDTGSREVYEDEREDDVVEVIIGPLKTTKINEVEKNITEIRKADQESIERIANKIEKQPPEEPDENTVQNKTKKVALTKASTGDPRLVRIHLVRSPK